ncbi:hypothetical protein [Roseateles saccharophilus]|uniref:Uncharacterized protein with HEPN domain n=1 Tax=Roseateles saccharophilus TaxID=304 RepID=A0A4R3VI44_ROSSA|nr:hypothetical protein [Roseateles saccharophilus]MDG0832046.1 hypothetical protein [Roseateles saccharophilus]TCV03454.1 uncharacterized protein with HEPN domain [Roseateles saccharophilus]
MYLRSLYDIVIDTGASISELTHEMQGEDELFRSTLTLRAIEAQLLIMAHTLGNVTPQLHQKLHQADWVGWAALHDKLRRGVQPRREEIWYAVNGLVPQTLALLQDLRRRQPRLFEWSPG